MVGAWWVFGVSLVSSRCTICALICILAGLMVGLWCIMDVIFVYDGVFFVGSWCIIEVLLMYHWCVLGELLVYSWCMFGALLCIPGGFSVHVLWMIGVFLVYYCVFFLVGSWWVLGGFVVCCLCMVVYSRCLLGV